MMCPTRDQKLLADFLARICPQKMKILIRRCTAPLARSSVRPRSSMTNTMSTQVINQITLKTELMVVKESHRWNLSFRKVYHLPWL